VVDNDDTATVVFLAYVGTRSETLLEVALPLVDAADHATILTGFSKAIVAMVPMAGRQASVLATCESRDGVVAPAGSRCEVWVHSAMAPDTEGHVCTIAVNFISVPAGMPRTGT
jgi:hypothetical protein